jgi:AsmA-like C-terminal region
MASPDKNSFGRKVRILLRRFRLCVMLLILTVLGALLYFNQVGLPGFAKSLLQERLRAHGLNLQFSRLRWRWNHGLVAENIRIGRTNEVASPKFSARQAQVRLDHDGFANLHVRVSGLVLQQGQLIWPVTMTNGSICELCVTNISTELNLLPGDLWSLDHFQAQFAGADVRLTGIVTNASAVRNWWWLRARHPQPGLWLRRLQRLADTLGETHFASPPQLKLDVQGDALDLQSFAVRLVMNTPDANTPWGIIRNSTFSMLMHPAVSNLSSRAELNLHTSEARTRWAGVTNLALKLNLVSVPPGTNFVQADLDLTAENIETEQGQAAGAHFTAQWVHSITNPIPLSGVGELQVSEATAKWGSAQLLHFTGTLLSATNAAPADDNVWAWWTGLAPFALDWECLARGLKSPKFEADQLFCSGEWRAPDLNLTQISGKLYGGKAGAQATLNVGTREFKFTSASDFDVQKLSPLLTEKSRSWLSQFSWNEPPKIQAAGSVTLPAWTNLFQADWHGDVRTTLRLDGNFQVGAGSFRGLSFRSAESQFTYSNQFWRLPSLVATRPEGWVSLVHESNERTREYYFSVRSQIDPRAFRQFLPPNQQRGLDIITFTKPPVIEGEIRGRWYEPERISAKATVALNNFSVRGETIDNLQTALEYTNGFLLCLRPHAERGAQQASATSLGLDFAAKKIYLTNGVGTLDPMIVPHMIGSNVTRIMEPYRFLHPPTARVNGVIPMRDPRDADLHFELAGGPFEWWKFKVAHIAGQVDWVGERLTLTNVEAQFYNGTAAGNAEFDFHRQTGTGFSFDLAASNADLHLLVADLTAKPNHLEGQLEAHLSISQARSDDLQSLQGHGRLSLRDGLIWDIPMFGVFSPVLDSLAPGLGLGNSRASECTATFGITNGVARTDDLQVRASMMRLQYWGSVDFKGNRVDARAQADLLRDTWVLGRVLSAVLWPVSKIFEYKITGTLHDPKSEPVFFVPRIIMLPLHPIRTIREMMPEEPDPIYLPPPQ